MQVVVLPAKSLHVEALQTLHTRMSNPHIHMYHYNAQQSRQSKGRQSRLSDYVDELGSSGVQEVSEEVVLVLVDALWKRRSMCSAQRSTRPLPRLGGSSMLRQWRTGKL